MLGVELACASAWLGRGPLGPGRGPDRPWDDDGPDDPAPAGWDWDAFDRARAAWSQRGAPPDRRALTRGPPRGRAGRLRASR